MCCHRCMYIGLFSCTGSINSDSGLGVSVTIVPSSTADESSSIGEVHSFTTDEPSSTGNEPSPPSCTKVEGAAATGASSSNDRPFRRILGTSNAGSMLAADESS